jgi:hypothetical protein
MLRPILSIALVPVFLSLSACGISGNLRGDPGYADFGSLGRQDANRTLALSLGPLPLRLAMRFAVDDPEEKALLEGLDAVRVYEYEIDGNVEQVVRRMDSVVNELARDGWIPVITVADDGEHVSIASRRDDAQRICGLVVMVQDRTELTLVNLIGEIRLEAAGAYFAGLGVDVPDAAMSELSARAAAF